MSSDLRDKNRRTTYKRITQQIRHELIQRVMQKGQNIKTVVNDMNVNISTAKAILKVYHEQGRVGKKKKRDKVINVIQTYSFFTIDGTSIQKMGQTVVQQQKKSIQTIENNDIEQQLKQKSKQRAQQLMKQIMQRHNNTTINTNNDTDQNQKVNQLAAYHNQMMYQFYNQGFGGYGTGNNNGMNFSFK